MYNPLPRLPHRSPFLRRDTNAFAERRRCRPMSSRLLSCVCPAKFAALPSTSRVSRVSSRAASALSSLAGARRDSMPTSPDANLGDCVLSVYFYRNGRNKSHSQTTTKAGGRHRGRGTPQFGRLWAADRAADASTGLNCSNETSWSKWSLHLNRTFGSSCRSLSSCLTDSCDTR